MTPEEQKKAETAKAEAEAKKAEEKADDSEKSDEEDAESKDTDKAPDYKALLEEEKRKREDAEKALAEKRFKSAERKRQEEEGEESEEESEEDKPVTRKELQDLVERTRSSTFKELQADRISDIAKGLADSDAEAELIVEIHKNRIFPSHLSLKEQLEESHAIANRKKLVSKNSELKRALASRENASNDAAGTHRDGMESTAPKKSAQDVESYKRAGFIYDSKTKDYRKKLPSGKILVKDPRTKATYIAK